jgi:hypothetical protein
MDMNADDMSYSESELENDMTGNDNLGFDKTGENISDEKPQKKKRFRFRR